MYVYSKPSICHPVIVKTMCVNPAYLPSIVEDFITVQCVGLI